MNEEFEARYDKLFQVWMTRIATELGVGRQIGSEGVIVTKKGTMAMTCRDWATQVPLWRIELLANEDEVRVIVLG